MSPIKKRHDDAWVPIFRAARQVLLKAGFQNHPVWPDPYWNASGKFHHMLMVSPPGGPHFDVLELSYHPASGSVQFDAVRTLWPDRPDPLPDDPQALFYASKDRPMTRLSVLGPRRWPFGTRAGFRRVRFDPKTGSPKDISAQSRAISQGADRLGLHLAATDEPHPTDQYFDHHDV